MKRAILLPLVLVLSAAAPAQTKPADISQAQLSAINDLPLSGAVAKRMIYKKPLNAAYESQMAEAGKDCEPEIQQGQQPYNICMGKAEQEADNDFAIFYNNLQMLCHDQDQLSTLQTSEKIWLQYRDSAMKATHAAWSSGTGAPGFSAQVDISLTRDRMRELHEIYGLNIAQ